MGFFSEENEKIFVIICDDNVVYVCFYEYAF